MSRTGWISAFAPASIANFGSGFDVFAAAIAKPGRGGRAIPWGDVVSVRRRKERGVRIAAILGDGGRLPKLTTKNCAAVAAAMLLRDRKAEFGLDLVLRKGLPLSSGLGSSAASAAAGAFAAALAIGGRIDETALLRASLAGEHVADGSWHGDNVWASLLGGGVVVPSTRPAEVIRLGAGDFRLVVVHPELELETRRARKALPESIHRADAVAQAGRFGALVAAWLAGDAEAVGRGLADRIAEPARASLVAGFPEARRAALRAGAFGVTFAGAGPSVFAVGPPKRLESIAEALVAGFARCNVAAAATIAVVDPEGARAVPGVEIPEIA